MSAQEPFAASAAGPRTAFAAAAAALGGVPFRLHGRDPATGLDCVGLVVAALERCGRRAVAPEGYALRALSVTPLLGFAERNGFAAAELLAPGQAGDLVLLRPSTIQAHLAVVLDDDHFVHAHAGLGKVVIGQGALPGETSARWRLAAVVCRIRRSAAACGSRLGRSQGSAGRAKASAGRVRL